MNETMKRFKLFPNMAALEKAEAWTRPDHELEDRPSSILAWVAVSPPGHDEAGFVLPFSLRSVPLDVPVVAE